MNSLSPTYVGSYGLAVRGRNLSRLAFACIFCFLLALLATPALAQEATIVGTVTDPTGATVSGATITITNNDTGIARTIPTSSDGQYVAPDLRIGHYTVSASAAGFKIAEHKNLVLNVGDRTRVDFKLEVGSTQEHVTVEANAVAVQTDSGEVSNVITGQQVNQLTTNGRSLYTLFALAPGASSIQTDRVGFTPVSGDSNVSINGQRPGHNLQLIDGGENLDRGGSSGSVMPSVDSIAEFRNLTSNYSAEYGLSSAATITTVIKSGTKQFHASAWEFLRNDALNARNYFNRPPNKVAELRYNVYGFNLGGQVPAWKEHPTFFFYNMEWRKQIAGGLLNQTVPFTDTYGGDFSNHLPADVKLNKDVDPNQAPIPFSGLHVPCQFQLSPTQQALFAGQTFSTPVIVNGTPSCSADPSKALNPEGSVTPVNQPFFSQFMNGANVSNALPFVDPNAAALLAAGIFPAASSDGQFHGGNNSPTNVREEIARVDHQFSDKFSIFGHWVSEQIAQTYGTTMWSNDNVPTANNTFGNPSYSAVVHATHTISPTLLNEIAFNYNGNRINILPKGLVSAPADFTFNRLFTGTNDAQRIPAIIMNGAVGAKFNLNWTPWVNKADDYQIRDDVSWTKGAHQFKVGASWALYKKIQNAFANTEGTFNFNGGFTGNDFADMLLGYAQSYNEDAVKINGHWNNVSWAAYIQDNWRVSKRLTLNLGLRWDGVPHTYEANQLSSNFYPGLYDSNLQAKFDDAGHICKSAADPGCTAPSPGLSTSSNPILAGIPFYTNGIGIGGKNGFPKGLVDNHWANFGPRIGFAYDLTGQGKTVFRGGFGIMYERIQGNDMYNGATNPPGNLQPTLNNVSLSNPGLNVTDDSLITAADLPVLPLAVTGIDKKFSPPVSYQYSIGVQQQLGANAVFSASYVGSQSRHQNDYRAINLPPMADLPAMVKSGAIDNQDVAYLGYGGIRLAYNEANSHYNSLQTSLTGTVHRDLRLQVAYTYSKAVDASTNGSGSGGDLNNVTNPYLGWKYDVGPGAFDRPHIFFANFIYDIPVFRTGSRAVTAGLGGWQISGIVTAQSGAPINLGVNGTTAASIIGNTGMRPDVTGKIAYPHTAAHWFDPSVFSAPACTLGGTGADCWGNLPFNAIRGPRRMNADLALFKNFTFTERFKVQFRADAFNAFNHTQFQGDRNLGGISNNVGSNNFGAVTGAFNGREWQLSLKLIY